MPKLVLTERGIEAIILAAIYSAILIVLSSIPDYGAILAASAGLGLILVGGYSLYTIWKERKKAPFFWIIMFVFGFVFEFGSIGDIAYILVYCVLIDFAIVLVSTLWEAIKPIISDVTRVLKH